MGLRIYLYLYCYLQLTNGSRDVTFLFARLRLVICLSCCYCSMLYCNMRYELSNIRLTLTLSRIMFLFYSILCITFNVYGSELSCPSPSMYTVYPSMTFHPLFPTCISRPRLLISLLFPSMYPNEAAQLVFNSYSHPPPHSPQYYYSIPSHSPPYYCSTPPHSLQYHYSTRLHLSPKWP